MVPAVIFHGPPECTTYQSFLLRASVRAGVILAACPDEYRDRNPFIGIAIGSISFIT